MARTINEDEYNAKRKEILDVVQRLIYTKGYEQMTIRGILDEMKISRGALYHYFDSKEALLEALVDRMGKDAEETLLPTVHDPELSALEKFRRYFEASASWKNTQKELILAITRMWFAEENALIRQKINREAMKHNPALMEHMIRQGIQEGAFTTRYPEEAAVFIVGITLSLTESVGDLMLSPKSDQAVVQRLESITAAYIDAIERILGAPPGSLQVFEPGAFNEWWYAKAQAPEAGSFLK